jgi:hypothetical protein
MDIAFATRSRFLADCEAAIRGNRAKLEAGGTLRVELEEGGYAGRVIVTIRRGDRTFGTDWEGADKTRFPVRIKAAATALNNCGCVGRFQVVHADGSLEVTRV